MDTHLRLVKFFLFPFVMLSIATASAVQLVPPDLSNYAQTTLPIVFLNTTSARRARPGDIVLARTVQAVRLGNGSVIPRGAMITGHVVAATPLHGVKIPWSLQKPSVLSVHFDTIMIGNKTVPLYVTVRAMADPFISEEALTPINHDIDASGKTTQVGGDLRYPWNAPVVNREGNVVGYTRHGGVYARLAANGRCDASSEDVALGIYSASACGLYGFVGVSALEMGTASHPSTLTLVSTHTSPALWKNSTALLEVLPHRQVATSR